MRSKFPVHFFPKMLLRTPDLLWPLLKLEFRKQRGVDIDYRFGKGRAMRVPMQISLRITNLCNHRCAVCGQYGEKGYMHSHHGKDLMNTVPFEKYKELVDQVAKYKPIFYVTGGEPFLYPDFVRLMNYVEKKGCLTTVVTNGVKLKEYAREIVENRWDMILVSFDGPETVHDACRGVKGAYQTAIDGLLELKKERKKQKKIRPYILTSLTLSPKNIDCLEETFLLNKEISPEIVIVYLSWFTGECLGHEHSRILKEELGIEAYTWKSYAKTFTEEESEKFASSLSRLRKKKWPFEYMVIPDLNARDVKDYYLHPEKTFGYHKCAAPFIMMDVMPNGDVVTCRDYIDIKVGNIMENSIIDIWNNKKFVDFRKLLIKKGGLLPQCTRCCGLMGF